jgi:perosamine synthetase
MAVLDRGELSGVDGVENTALEREYAAYVGSRFCLSLNSGTAALHCCAAAMDLCPGDEVIVPAFTFIATAMAMCHQGAIPVFCDVDPVRFNLDPQRIGERITDRTRAILPVHLHGMPADIDEIRGIADAHGLAVIEDFAQAHGATYRGRRAGTLGDCGATSLQETKNLPGGDGGLFVCDDEEAHRAASRLRLFGEDLRELEFGRFYWSHGVGFNYRNHELSAALARSQLKRLDASLGRARENAARLSHHLASIPGIDPPQAASDRQSSWYSYRVILNPAAVGFTGDVRDLRDRVLRALQAEGVPVSIWQDFPLPAHPAFARCDAAEHPVSAALPDISFLLTSHTEPLSVLSPCRIDDYATAVRKVFAHLEPLLEAPLEPISRGPS